MQCGDSPSPYSSGSKVSPIGIVPAGVSQPPSSIGGEGISGFLWWPIAVASAGAAMLACCAFLAIAAYRRRKRSKKDPSAESSDIVDSKDFPSGAYAEDEIEESSSQPKLSRSSPSKYNFSTAGWVKADMDDPEAGVVIPTGLVSSHSILRSLQLQAAAFRVTEDVLKDAPAKESRTIVSELFHSRSKLLAWPGIIISTVSLLAIMFCPGKVPMYACSPFSPTSLNALAGEACLYITTQSLTN